MHSADIFVAVVLALFALRGYARGLLHELMSLATFLFAGGLGLHFNAKMAARIADSVPGPAVLDNVAGFLIIFGLTVMTGRLVISFVERMWLSAAASPLNRLGGTVFSIFKGGVLIGCTVLVLRAIPPSGDDAGLREAVTAPVSEFNEYLERSYLPMRLADLSSGLFAAFLENADGRVRRFGGNGE